MQNPTTTFAPVIETVNVSGVKFEICEVKPQGYEFLNHAKNRFFVAVEESFVVGLSAAQTYFNETGKTRWAFFCGTKQDCKEKIARFEAVALEIQKCMDKATRYKGEMGRAKIEQANNLRKQCMERYGTHPI